MDVALGFLGIVVWIVLVIALAAAVTWIVVKISPAEKREGPEYAPKSEA